MTKTRVWQPVSMLAFALAMVCCRHQHEPLSDTIANVTASSADETDGTFTQGDNRPHQSCPYEGTYLDEDINEPNLTVTYRQNDGKYDVQIGIFRLTELDDGVGTVGEEGLSFTATDAAGNPIGGVITLQGDTATVTFTRTTWELIEPGASFLYVRQRD